LSSGGGTADIDSKITSMSAQKLDEKATHNAQVVFNVGINIEELSRKSNAAILKFQMTVGTEPSIAKFLIGGIANVTGSTGQIDMLLSNDSETGIPRVLTPIFQEVYSLLFMMASTLNVPHPSPALLKKAHVVKAT
jgi:hypothetical protein